MLHEDKKTTTVFGDEGQAGNSNPPEAGLNIASAEVRKAAPNALAEELNHQRAKEGATIMVVSENDRQNVKYITNKFYLSNFSMQFREKAQLVETFGASSVSFFDDSVKIYNLSGQAVDYPSDSYTPHESMQQSSMIQLYNNHMRATKLVKDGSIAILKVLNHLVYGYPLNLQTRYNASQDKIANFSMSWVVSKHTLTIPGMFDEKDLADMYNPEYKGGLPDDVSKATREAIDNFLRAYKLNLKLNFETSGSRKGFLKFNIPQDITPYGGKPIYALNSYLRNLTGDKDDLKELKTQIKDGINSMITYVESFSGTGFFAASSGVMSMFTGNSLEKAKNSVESMFKKPQHLNNVVNFLKSLQAIETKLFMTKIFL